MDDFLLEERDLGERDEVPAVRRLKLYSRYAVFVRLLLLWSDQHLNVFSTHIYAHLLSVLV